MASVAASWRTIKAVLWENGHSVFQALRKPATDAQIARLSKLMPAKLTRDFVQSLMVHDGPRDSHLGVTGCSTNFALLPISAIIAEYRTMCSLQEECGFGGNQVGSDAEVRNDTHWRRGWLPVMDADGDKLVLDLDPASSGSAGQVFEWPNTGSTPI